MLRSINTEGAQEQMQTRVNKDDVKIKPSSLSIKGIKYGYVLNSIFNQKSDFHPIHSTHNQKLKPLHLLTFHPVNDQWSRIRGATSPIFT